MHGDDAQSKVDMDEEPDFFIRAGDENYILSLLSNFYMLSIA